MDMIRMTRTIGLCFSLFLGILLLGSCAIAEEQKGLTFEGASAFGGPGDQGAAQTGMGLTAAGGKLYLSGTDFAAGKSLLFCFSDPAGSSPLWALRWPNAKSVGGNEESFASVVVTQEGIYCAGRTWAMAKDTIGGKEQKALLVKFPLNGPTGPGEGGCLWMASPLFFPYTGIETLIGLDAAEEGGLPVLYAAGRGQYNGSDNTAVAAKFDSAGKLLWKKVLGKEEWNAWSQGDSVLVHNGSIYVAGYAHWQGPKSWLGFKNPIRPHAALWKLDPNGNVIWVRESPQPIKQDSRPGIAVAAKDHFLYVACTRELGTDGVFTHDLLVLKYDENGNLIWSKEWGSTKDEVVTGIAVKGNSLYAVGYTNGWVGGAHDAFLVEMDAGSGNVLSVTHHGAAGEEIPHSVAVSGKRLYVLGDSKDPLSYGSTSGPSDFMLLGYSLTRELPPLSLKIDIKPGSEPNPISLKSQGKIPVAILSTAEFDAVAQIDRSSVTFGRTGAEKSLASPGCKPEDVNGDGLIDLICHFDAPLCGFQVGDTRGLLMAKTRSGRSCLGSDSVVIVPKEKEEPPTKPRQPKLEQPQRRVAPPQADPKGLKPSPGEGIHGPDKQDGSVVY